jgi:uncharacterized ParB-like nuclease family protein
MFSLSSDLFKKLLGASGGGRNRLVSFHDARQREQAEDCIDRGTRMVPIEKIVGTVGRYNDFDGQFRPRKQSDSPRLLGIMEAMQTGQALPPVSLYQIKDAFFVLDGHHRVLAARELGREEISACIVELLPSADTLENQLYREQVEFRDKAGLAASIELTELDQFVHLEQQIRIHQAYLSRRQGREVEFIKAAADWYQTIYTPLASLIRNSGLVDNFSGRTVDDLYLYISVHQWGESRERRYGIGIDELIPKDMEAFREKMAQYKEKQYPEMKRNITVFVLINVEGKHEQKIMDRLFALEEVKELHSVHGSIDLIVKIVLQRDLLCSDAEVISQFTHAMIRPIRGVQSTQTLIPGLSRVKE